MTHRPLYADKLIRITETEIVFFNYYFPTGREKIVKIEDIESVAVQKATARNGKWRIHGTGNFKIWFPRDGRRPKRDRIFFAVLKHQWVDIGFTVEDGDAVQRILSAANLIKA